MTRAGAGVTTVIVDDHGAVELRIPTGVPPDAVFELGSVTKTVTAALVALAAEDGLLDLDDEIGRWLDAGANATITVRELATHTAGLPRVAGRSVAANTRDPYRALDARAAERDLRLLTRASSAYGYSNFGYQLLGLVLERACGQGYADLVDEWLPRRFGVSEVGMTVAGSAQTGRVAGATVPAWRQPLPAAGALSCTAAGLAAWLRAHVDPSAAADATARRALSTALTPTVRIDTNRESGLAWVLGSGGVAQHDGQTAGFAAATALDLEHRRAAGALCADSERGPELVCEVLALSSGVTPSVDPPPDEQWAGRTRSVLEALCADRTDDVRAMMTPQLRERISREALSATWLIQSTATGPVHDTEIRCRSRGRYTEAEATLRGATRDSRVVMVFTSDAEIARFALLRNDQPTPW